MSLEDYFCNNSGHDSNYNCQILFEIGIIPNIKQRSGSANRGKSYRSKAAKTFLAVCVVHGPGPTAFLVVRLGV